MNKSTETKKVGLVLGSGAARGLAHIGVIKALEERNIKPHCIAGSSIGALVGACYAKSGSISELEELVLATDWRKLVGLVDFNLAFFLKGFIHGDKVKELLSDILGDLDFSDLKVPLSIVATDLIEGKAVVFKEGSVLDAVRASISIPAIFTPVKYKKTYLIDGGIVSPLPVQKAKDRGADFIIACNVIQPPKRRKTFTERSGQKEGAVKKDTDWDKKITSLLEQNEEISRNVKDFMKKVETNLPELTRFMQRDLKDFPNIFDVIIQALYSMEYEVLKARKKDADIIITPATENIASLEFFRAEEAIREGYRQAGRVLDEYFD